MSHVQIGSKNVDPMYKTKPKSFIKIILAMLVIRASDGNESNIIDTLPKA